MPSHQPKAPRNRTLTLSNEEFQLYCQQLGRLDAPAALPNLIDSIVHQDLLEALPYLPARSVDLLILDPPYNRSKTYNQTAFNQKSPEVYQSWFEHWFVQLLAMLKPTATVYVCADWQSSAVIYPVLTNYLKVRNRITWEREKGRGAQLNWKNSSEDIWFCTVSDSYFFDVAAVKLKRRVMAPYRDTQGQPKDWQETGAGRFRETHPSNLWTDISVPFWSMPENTDHPTQKPEKLIAKLLLASSQVGDVVLDPFLGSGTTAVVARKLNRHYIGIEIDQVYCCLAQKRLALAAQDNRIQGYAGGYFWERNSLPYQNS
ncbi:MAG: site-specific DNA-methyltransferase [Cyanobacteria bacterium Co-bin13]|nr:site-specific DNA-methyltransferase [Cyanobacteria bacterium Co-bin13]